MAIRSSQLYDSQLWFPSFSIDRFIIALKCELDRLKKAYIIYLKLV